MDINQFYLGDWHVSPAANSLRLGKTTKTVEPKAMDVLLLLCQNAGEVLSADVIVEQCWGDAEIGDNPIHKAINQLRKVLGDSASNPSYIETIRRRGYRVVADVSFPETIEPELQLPQWQGSSPYPGLSAFEPKQANVYFGRQTQVNQLLAQLSEQIAASRTFTLILGASGSGKSSLINAGVLPKLIADNGFHGIKAIDYALIDFADIHQGGLFSELASAMLDWECHQVPVFDGLSADDLAQKLTGDIESVIAMCQAIITKQQYSTNITTARFFLSIDRLEVLLSSSRFSSQERSEFLAVIDALACSDSVIIYSACRNDFYPQVVEFPSLMKGKQDGSHFDLAAPTPNELSQMVRLPALAAGLNWSVDEQTGVALDELLTNEASGHPDALPLLQYTLQELYLQRGEGQALLAYTYRDLGGIEGAIGSKAEQVYRQLASQNEKDLSHVLSLLVTLNEDGSITSKAAKWSELLNQQQRDFVDALVENRLFVSHLQHGQACFSVAHEALLRRWSRVETWLSAHRDSLVAKYRIQQQTKHWLDDNRSTAYLLADGKPLEEAKSLLADSTFELKSNEQALIQSSIALSRRKRWLKRGTITMLCLLTLVSVMMSIRSQYAEDIAQQKRQEAESLLGFMVGEFADKLRSVERMDLLDGISNKALEYFSTADTESTDFLSRIFPAQKSFVDQFQHAQTLEAMGEVAYSRGKPDEAEQAFLAAKSILTSLHERQADNLEVLKTLGENAFWLGQLKYDAGELALAKLDFTQYRDFSIKYSQLEPDSVEAQIELAFSQNTLGSIAVRMQEYENARKAFEHSLSLFNQISEKKVGDVDLIVETAANISWLATVYEHLGNYQTGIKLRSEAQKKLFGGLELSEGNAGIIEGLVLNQWQLARALSYSGKYSEAMAKIDTAKELLVELLAQDPGNKFWIQHLNSIQSFQLALASEQQSFNPDLDTMAGRLLVKLANDEPFRISAATYLTQYFQLSNYWELSQQALEHLNSKVEKASLKNRKDPEALMVLSNVYLVNVRQAEFVTQAEQTKQTNELCSKVTSSLGPITQKSKKLMFWLPFVIGQQCVGQSKTSSLHIKEFQKQGIAIPSHLFINPTKKKTKI
ncbi:winged helix-turn-helix domain-containing protein [Aliiglaciecola sp.]|nr:winged helix-turn-helix domain-containing protein [Aliiglaciecola sp.]